MLKQLSGAGWALDLANAMAVYLAVFAGGGVLVQLARRLPLRLRQAPLVQFLCFDRPQDGGDASAPANDSSDNTTAKLLLAAAGIYSTLISQGVFQERLMTQDYSTGRFTSSGFAILCTRLLACAVAQICIMCRPKEKQPHNVAFYKFSYLALANIVSSWCQYESLKHTSFPVTTLAKSAKTIPVMVMVRCCC